MRTLDRRITALEHTIVPTDEITTIMRIEAGAEIDIVTGRDGQIWMRLPAESERTFLDRACREAKREQGETIRLIASERNAAFDGYRC